MSKITPSHPSLLQEFSIGFELDRSLFEARKHNKSRTIYD